VLVGLLFKLVDAKQLGLGWLGRSVYSTTQLSIILRWLFVYSARKNVKSSTDFPRHNDFIENGQRKGMFLGYDVAPTRLSLATTFYIISTSSRKMIYAALEIL
jgi:hypothetical protein